MTSEMIILIAMELLKCVIAGFAVAVLFRLADILIKIYQKM